MENKNNLLKRITVAPFPHSVSIFFTGSSFLFGSASINSFSKGDYVGGSLYGFATLISAGTVFFAQLDAHSRYNLYQAANSFFSRNGWSERYVEKMMGSRCQRDSLTIAARDNNYGEEIEKKFKESGYRWYRVFPDFVFKDPLYFFTKNFWKTSFFVKPSKNRNLNKIKF